MANRRKGDLRQYPRSRTDAPLWWAFFARLNGILVHDATVLVLLRFSSRLSVQKQFSSEPYCSPFFIINHIRFPAIFHACFPAILHACRRPAKCSQRFLRKNLKKYILNCIKSDFPANWLMKDKESLYIPP